MDAPLKINMERAGTSVHDMSPLGRCEAPKSVRIGTAIFLRKHNFKTLF